MRPRIESLIALAAILLAAHGAGADSIKTVTKKVPAFESAVPDIPAEHKNADIFKRWGIEAWWRQEKYSDSTYIGKYQGIPLYSTQWVTVGNGMLVSLCSPDVVGAITRLEANSKLLDDAHTQALYREKVAELCGEYISFVGYVQLSGATFGIDAMDGPWTMVLIGADGKRYEPKTLNLEIVQDVDVGLNCHAWRRKFTAVFQNRDAQGSPVISAATRLVTLGLGSAAGQVKVKFEFDSKKK